MDINHWIGTRMEIQHNRFEKHYAKKRKTNDDIQHLMAK